MIILRAEPVALRDKNASVTGYDQLATGGLVNTFLIMNKFQMRSPTFKIHKLFSVPMPHIRFDTYIILRHYSFINFIKLFNVNSIHVELY